jgi:diguanylate cyclase (GGDEF)-like protein
MKQRFSLNRFIKLQPPRTEKEYRDTYLKDDISQLRVVLILIILATVIFFYTDFILLKNSVLFYWVISLRFINLIFSLLLTFLITKVTDPKKFDRYILIWGLFTISFLLFVNYTSPPDYIGHSFIDVVILFLITIGNPSSFYYRLSLSTYFTIGNIILLFISRKDMPPSYLIVILFSIVIVYAGGMILSARLNLFRSNQYSTRTAELELREELEMLASTDGLTGILNRRVFFEEAEKEMIRAKRYGQHFSVLMIDIDDFKNINDTHGHQYGDEVINSLVKIVKKLIRQTDYFGRIGGEEFVIILIETRIKNAEKIAERIRKSTENDRVLIENQKSICFTISVGITEFNQEDRSFSDVLHRSDMAMYKAKKFGKNKVEIIP